MYPPNGPDVGSAPVAAGSGGPPTSTPGPAAASPARTLPVAGIAAAAAVVVLAAGSTVYGLYLVSHNAQRAVPGLVVGGENLGGVPLAEIPARVHAISERFLDQKIRLRIGREKPKRRLRELGVRIEEARLVSEIRGLGHSGDPVLDLTSYLRGKRRGYRLNLPVSLDEKAATEYLIELKDEVDR